VIYLVFLPKTVTLKMCCFWLFLFTHSGVKSDMKKENILPEKNAILWPKNDAFFIKKKYIYNVKKRDKLLNNSL